MVALNKAKMILDFEHMFNYDGIVLYDFSTCLKLIRTLNNIINLKAADSVLTLGVTHKKKAGCEGRSGGRGWS